MKRTQLLRLDLVSDRRRPEIQPVLNQGDVRANGALGERAADLSLRECEAYERQGQVPDTGPVLDGGIAVAGVGGGGVDGDLDAWDEELDCTAEVNWVEEPLRMRARGRGVSVLHEVLDAVAGSGRAAAIAFVVV